MYKGRLAPSPTGLLHLGHAATFLTAHDRAHAANGNLLLRIDDLDPQRSKDQYLEAVRADLTWLGITWNAELRQSNRLDLYHNALESLLRRGSIYPCTCTRKDLQEAIHAPHEDVDEPLYNGRCRPNTLFSPPPSQAQLSSRPEAQRAVVESPAISQPPTLQPDTNYRFRVPDHQTVHFIDLNQGPQHFTAGRDFGDFLVWRKDGLPSYQLANVVDDAETNITEVVRGRDLLKSTARQILLQRALNLSTPQYFHTNLLRDDRGERLAKRHDALSLRALRESGMTPAEVRSRIANLTHHRHRSQP